MKKQTYLKINIEILQCLELTWQEKIVFAEVLHLHGLGSCYAPQKHFCALLNIKKDVCSRVFKNLIKKKYIIREGKTHIPLKFVDNKSTNNDKKELTKDQLKVDQRSTEVDQKSTTHYIYKDKTKIKKEESHEQIEEVEIIEVNEEIETPPLYVSATKKLVEYLENNPDQIQYIEFCTKFKGSFDLLRTEVVDFCLKYNKNKILMESIIKSPMGEMGAFTKWMNSDFAQWKRAGKKAGTKNQVQKQQGISDKMRAFLDDDSSEW